MLLWSRWSRAAAWVVFAILFLGLFGLPFAALALAAIADGWSGALPDAVTTSHLSTGLSEGFDNLYTSVWTGVVASVIALVIGTWGAISAQWLRSRGRRFVDAYFLMPIGVPSVATGLAMLVAFSHDPVTLNGTAAIVLVAHTTLLTAFAYQAVTASLVRIDPSYQQVATSLGARPAYALRRILLPLLLPGIVAAFSLCFAYSMGELGATVMVYPANWTTMPVAIVNLTDRGQVYLGGAMAVLLLCTTLAVMLIVSRVRSRSEYR